MPSLSLALCWMTAGAGATGLPDVDAPHKTGERVAGEAAVVIGLEDYFVLPDVPFARRDAQAFHDLLVYTRGIPAANVQLLDGQPVREQMLRAVEEAATHAGRGGTVWVYFAGHGAASPSSGERVLLGADVQADVAVFDTRALPLDELREAATSAGGKAVLVLDACYTGRGRGGGEIVSGKRFAVPSYATSSDDDVLEWSAASAGQWSGPLDGAQHGAFTYSVIGALRGWADGQLDDVRDGQVTAEEADLYVREALRALDVRDQTPVLATGDARDWVLSKGRESAPSLGAAAVAAPAPPAPTTAPSVPAPASSHDAVRRAVAGAPAKPWTLRKTELGMLEQLLEAVPTDSSDWSSVQHRVALALCEEAMNRFHAGDAEADAWLKRAAQALARLNQIDPDYEHTDEVYFMLGHLFRAMGQPENAKVFFEGILSKHPESGLVPDAREALAQLSGSP